MDVFNQRRLEDLLIVEVDHGNWHPGEPGCLRRTQTPLAGDQLKAVAHLTHNERLQDAVGPDRLAEGFDFVLIEGLARLEGILVNGVDRDLRRCAGGSRPLLLGGAEQRVEPTTEPRLAFHEGPSSGAREKSVPRCGILSLAIGPKQWCFGRLRPCGSAKPQAAGGGAIALSFAREVGVRFAPLTTRNGQSGPRTAPGEEVSMKGFIAAAGLSTRLQDLGETRNKVLLDLGGETILGSLLGHFELAGVTENLIAVGYDGLAVRALYGTRARCFLNPFFEQHGILSSVWLARPFLDGQPFLFSVGDHYCALSRLQTFLADQPAADILVDVELKTCDDEDMKVFVNRAGNFRTMTKAFLDGPVLGEFTGMVRFSAEGSQQFFEMLERHVWQHGIGGCCCGGPGSTPRHGGSAFHFCTHPRRL